MKLRVCGSLTVIFNIGHRTTGSELFFEHTGQT